MEERNTELAELILVALQEISSIELKGSVEQSTSALSELMPLTKTHLKPILAQRKNFTEADKHLREALAGRSFVLGAAHPDTLTTKLYLFVASF